MEKSCGEFYVILYISFYRIRHCLASKMPSYKNREWDER